MLFRKKKLKYLISLLFFINLSLFSQNQNIDKIIATVGEDIVLKSQLEQQAVQYAMNGMQVTEELRCVMLEDILFQRLLLHQAKMDSIEISDKQVEGEMNRRLRYFIAQIGSEEKLEEYYKKSIPEIKAEFYDNVKEQLLIQQMQQKITTGVKVSPLEVKEYFESIPKDSLPFIESELQIAHIVKIPPVNEQSKLEAKNKLQGILDRVRKGEDFGTMAVLYSEDPGSAKSKGELGFMNREDLVPEFSAVAFKLQKGQVSDIVETKFGFHIIQMIQTRGEQANVRHILIKPKVNIEDLEKAKNQLDSIYEAILTNDTLNFEKAAEIYSDDKETKQNKGVVMNPQTGTTKFDSETLGQLAPTVFFKLEKAKVGEMLRPLPYTLADGTNAFRIVKLVSRTEPHIASLTTDYPKIQEAALTDKQNKVLIEWSGKQIPHTLIKVDKDYHNCKFENNWVNVQ